MPAPSIKFIDSLVGPSPVAKQWRDLVGVVGTFSRGPEVPIQVEDIKTFASTYGIDSTTGSLFVQQAMANGLNRFVVVRASASSNPASTKITFSSESPQISPIVGFVKVGNSLEPSSQRTTGFKLDFNYIGKPIVTNSIYTTVDSRRGQVNLPQFQGIARFNFFVTKAVEGRSSSNILHSESSLNSLTLEVDTVLSPSPGYFVGLIKKDAQNYTLLKEYIRPGYSLTLVAETPSDDLIIASSIIENYSLDYDAILLRSDKKHSHIVWGLASGYELPSNSNSVSVPSTTKLKVGKIRTLLGNYSNLISTGNPAEETATFKALKQMILLIDGKEYTQASDPVALSQSVFPINTTVATENSTGQDLPFSFDDIIEESISEATNLDNIEGTSFEFTLTGSLPSIQGGSSVSFLPVVETFTSSSSSTSITVTGLFSSELTSSTDAKRLQTSTIANYYIVIDGIKYSITGVAPITGASHKLNITVNGQVSNISGKAVYIYYEPSTADQSFQIRAPKVAQYVMGYSFDSQSGTIGNDYFTLRQDYNNGTSIIPLDNTFLLTEKAAGRYFSFGYYTRPSFESSFDVKAFPLQTRSFGIELLFGPQSNSITSLPLAEGGSFAVPFAKTSVSVGAPSSALATSFKDGDMFTEIVKDIELALRSNNIVSSLISDITIEESVLVNGNVQFKPTISFTSTYSGDQANRINWKLTRYTTDASTVPEADKVKDVLLDGAVGKFDKINYFQGGYDGARAAFKDLYAADGTLLWRIEAITPGVYGNNISCSVRNQRSSTKNSSFEIEVQDLNSQVIASDSKFITTVSTGNIDYTTGRSLAFSSTSLVQIYFMPIVSSIARNISLDSNHKVFKQIPQRLAPPLERISTAFSGGETGFSRQGSSVLSLFYLSNGSDTSQQIPTKQSLAQGLIKGLSSLDSFNIAALAIPGIYYGDPDFDAVFSKAIDSVNKSTPESGLRSAVFELPPGIDPDRAKLLADRLDNERIVLLAGSQLLRGYNGLLVPNVGSSGSYIGYDLSRAPNLSPAASYPTALVRSVVSVDTPTITSYLDRMSDAGVEVLLFDSNLGGYRFCNGLTTSRQLAKRYRSVSRILDQIKTDLYLSLQWCRSRPNTPALQSEVASTCDTYLYSKLRDGWFTNLEPTICSEANNTVRDQLEGRLNVRIRFTPSFPADTIIVSSILDISDDFTIQTTV
jgi:hypothetical protein